MQREKGYDSCGPRSSPEGFSGKGCGRRMHLENCILMIPLCLQGKETCSTFIESLELGNIENLDIWGL